MSTMIERVAAAMEDAAFGYSMKLVRLVDGVSTYSLVYSDGESHEFSHTDDVYEHVAEKKRRTQARAAIEAMRNVDDESPELLRAGKKALYSCSSDPELEDARGCWEAIIDAALKETA